MLSSVDFICSAIVVMGLTYTSIMSKDRKKRIPNSKRIILKKKPTLLNSVFKSYSGA